MTTIALRYHLRRASTRTGTLDDRREYLRRARLKRAARVKSQRIVAEAAQCVKNCTQAIQDRDRAIRERDEAVEREARMAPIHARATRCDRLGPDTWQAACTLSLREYAMLILHSDRQGYLDHAIHDTAMMVAHKAEMALRQEIGTYMGYGGRL